MKTNTTMTNAERQNKLEETHKAILKIELTLRKSAHSMSEVRRELLEEKLEDLNDEFISLTNDINANA
jgi:hypothetical protein